ncbi:Peroxiredoxin, AhpC-type like protein [Aduncisulcus paluster]|uniref:Peroxiredoxin, AhpC-type like protein n=1 Tax=Aduncisulcus paluster TaxID=2918883 RepID=A0ABQ5JSH1_9EUKA|nr:Peroxiredoxin, AhpC-type like protein [Aduncisulcus paluster]|eukprot:gnl/Carplike_NY0171/380_a523_2668.p1 GENE.gnl/Carplike_NY0171/380_a523_2668~~gnl/Carplike_NY0171/380_a523_2668.p1  ORF type:complete len:197 (-),score=68.30 gnl/Carplike_NY0171/380_a523_2668:121-711(-)
MSHLIGKPAPRFECPALMPDFSFKTLTNDDYKGKYLVIMFYPMDYTFVCPTEIIRHSEAVESFKKEGAEIVVASTDSEYVHLSWAATPKKQGGLGAMKMPMLADRNLKMSKAFGCLIEEEGVALRATYIINREGIIVSATINNLPVGRNADETLRLIQAFKYVDEHDGEGIPCGWTPGEKTIKTDPEGKLEWFQDE